MKKIAKYGTKMLVIDEREKTADLYEVADPTAAFKDWQISGESTNHQQLTDEQIKRLLVLWAADGSRTTL